jgi:hypothetical protein
MRREGARAHRSVDTICVKGGRVLCSGYGDADAVLSREQYHSWDVGQSVWCRKLHLNKEINMKENDVY